MSSTALARLRLRLLCLRSRSAASGCQSFGIFRRRLRTSQNAWITTRMNQVYILRRQPPRVGLRFVPDLDRFGYEDFYSPGPMPRVPGFHCNLFWKAPYVFPDGSLIPTHFCHFRPVGNLRRQSFASLWNGPEYRQIRRAVCSHGWISLCGYCFQPYGGCI